MARPIKHTVDYFPHDAAASNGKTLTILEARYQNNGYSFWFKILETLANSPDHYYDCRNPLNWEFLLAKTHLPYQIATEILNLLVELEAIDKTLWQEYKVIWSDNLVTRIADAYKNRRNELPTKPSFNGAKPTSPDESTIINTPLTDNQDISTTNNTQTKLKETKLKETKLKERVKKETFAEFLTRIKVEFLITHPDIDVDHEWMKCQAWWSDSNKQMKRPQSALVNWLDNAVEFKQGVKINETHQGKPQSLVGKYAHMVVSDAD